MHLLSPLLLPKKSLSHRLLVDGEFVYLSGQGSLIGHRDKWILVVVQTLPYVVILEGRASFRMYSSKAMIEK